jgi:transcriptional regulator with XRE-family HTH domain
VSYPNRIRELRELRKREMPRLFTQAGLASQIPVDTATLRRWEAGATVPTRRHAKALAQCLGVTVEGLGLPSQYPAGDSPS